MSIAIIKYNAGNIQSVQFALERIGQTGIVTDDAATILAADKVIFPGVGEAGSAMQYLKEKQLVTLIRNLQQPVLGICLGMQLLCRFSEEASTECIGVFDTEVKKFNRGLKVPHVGWNNIDQLKGPLFKGIEAGVYCYFVHSYYAQLCDSTIAHTQYGADFSSALQKDNFYGVQFHPEKSAAIGKKIIENFLAL